MPDTDPPPRDDVPLEDQHGDEDTKDAPPAEPYSPPDAGADMTKGGPK
jgi:hypothetical protein